MITKEELIKDMYNVISRDNIPQEEWNIFAPKVSVLYLKKGDFLIKEGEIPEKIAYISSGICRYFCLNNAGEEKTIVLRRKGTFVSAFTSYLENRKSKLSIQALEKTTILYISIEDYVEMLETSRFWQLFAWKQGMQVIIEKEKREIEILAYDAETKYKKFLEEFPGLEDRINHYHIASYLGISNVTLSRIRKKVLNESIDVK